MLVPSLAPLGRSEDTIEARLLRCIELCGIMWSIAIQSREREEIPAVQCSCLGNGLDGLPFDFHAIGVKKDYAAHACDGRDPVMPSYAGAEAADCLIRITMM